MSDNPAGDPGAGWRRPDDGTPDPYAPQPAVHPAGAVPPPAASPVPPHDAAAGYPYDPPPDQPAPYGPQPGYPGGPGHLPYGGYADPSDPLVSADVSGWWSRTFALLKATWGQLALVQLYLLGVPIIVVLGLLLLLRVPLGNLSLDNVLRQELAVGVVVVIAVAVVVPFIVLSVMAQLAGVQIAVQAATGQTLSIRAASRTALRRSPALLGWSFLACLTVLLGLLLCLLPGLYAIAALLVLPVVILLERGGGISRCFRLFHAHLGTSVPRVLIYLALVIGLSLVNGVLSTALTLIGYTTGSTEVFEGAGSLVDVVFWMVQAVITPPLLLTTYADMRARLEPFSTAYLRSPA